MQLLLQPIHTLLGVFNLVFFKRLLPFSRRFQIVRPLLGSLLFLPLLILRQLLGHLLDQLPERLRSFVSHRFLHVKGTCFLCPQLVLLAAVNVFVLDLFGISTEYALLVVSYKVLQSHKSLIDQLLCLLTLVKDICTSIESERVLLFLGLHDVLLELLVESLLGGRLDLPDVVSCLYFQTE